MSEAHCRTPTDQPYPVMLDVLPKKIPPMASQRGPPVVFDRAVKLLTATFLVLAHDAGYALPRHERAVGHVARGGRFGFVWRDLLV